MPDAEKKGISSLSAEDRAEFLKVCGLLPKMTVETKVFVEEEDEDDESDNNKSNNNNNSNSNVTTLANVGNNRTEIKGDQIFEQDLVTLRVIITRENLPDQKSATASAVYAPHFPTTVYENLWIVLLGKSAT